jgi:DNA-binding transcriptional regulator YhcF (GntR family)
MKTTEEAEQEFTEAVRHFIDTAIAGGYSLDEAKAMARDVVAQAPVQGSERRELIHAS